MSQLYEGVGVGGGVVIGPVLRMPEPLPDPPATARPTDVAVEFARAIAALEFVATELTTRSTAVEERNGFTPAAEILRAEAMMALDPTLVDDVRGRTLAGATADYAIFAACAAVAETLERRGGLMAERAADITDISQRARASLSGLASPGVPHSDTPFILLAKDLAPADTALLDPAIVIGIVTANGGPTSHTAILARALSIPAVVGAVGVLNLSDGATVILDAASGSVTAAPTATARGKAETRMRRRAAEAAAIAAAPLTPGALADGTPIALLANLSEVSEVEQALALGAEGVGLFRTELVFLGRASAPSVAEQTAIYSQLLSAFPGQKVVIRVLDAGADKPLEFLAGTHEDNPALGLRGLRALRAHESVLRDQLAALAAAQDASTADMWVMAPMVADPVETEYFVSLGRSFGLRTVGVMAEVPSLALMADEVVRRCDFVSIGTNDLTQYTVAADRGLASVAQYQDPWNPAVLRLIKMLGDAALASDTPLGVCGEAAADPQLAVVLVGLGATSLSMSPQAIAEVRATLAQVTWAEARATAQLALTSVNANSASRLRASRLRASHP
ncbi:MAG: phosphoenolpyruvate--protein phosphotransferase [Microbacteriaceae bacterium]